MEAGSQNGSLSASRLQRKKRPLRLSRDAAFLCLGRHVLAEPEG